MSLYPSLEDMQVDKLTQAQIVNGLSRAHEITNFTGQSSLTNNSSSQLYPEIGNFLGLELTENMIRANMPQYFERQQMVVESPTRLNIQNYNTNMTAPLSSSALIPAKAEVNHGIREVTLCKGADGKIGLRVQAVNNGIFIVIVVKNSPAALVNLRFGDQILQLNGQLLAGYSVTQVHKMLKNSQQNNISMVIRDRPFERTVTLFKDSVGSVGFQLDNGKIVSIVKDSSAARNGLLTDHNLLEINGQTVVGMKDKDIKKIIEDSDNIIKITIIPSFIYDHMVNKLSSSFLRGIMDHSLSEL